MREAATSNSGGNNNMWSYVVFLAVLTKFSFQEGEYYVSTPWSYGDKTGPGQWGEVFEKCYGSRQSPIDLTGGISNLNFGEMTYSTDYTDNKDKKELINYGNALVLSVKDSVPLVYGDDSIFNDARYHLLEVRFHLGSDNSRGSEHSIEGIKYPLEIQFVHYDSERDDSIEWSVGTPDAVLVYGILAEVDSKDNEELEKVFRYLPEVEYESSRTTIEDTIDFTKLLPEDRSFYKYSGSFTMPPCEEEVTWIVFKNPIHVSQQQLDNLRKLRNNEGPMADNFRPLQSLNGREIYKSF